MITMLLILYNGTDVQYICTDAFMVYNVYRCCCIHTYIMHIQVQHVCMHDYQFMDQPGKAANPARGQLKRENE